MKEVVIQDTLSPTERRKALLKRIMMFSAIAMVAAFIIMNPAFADATSTVKDVLGSVIKVIELVFQVVGVVLSVYSVAQLVLAIKNEDADAKTRASTQLVVGIILIAIPSIIDALGLVDKITVSI